MLNEQCIYLKQFHRHMGQENIKFDREVKALVRKALAIIIKEHYWADMAVERMYDDRVDGGKNITDKTPYVRYCWALCALEKAVVNLTGIEAVRAIHEIQLPEF